MAVGSPVGIVGGINIPDSAGNLAAILKKTHREMGRKNMING